MLPCRDSRLSVAATAFACCCYAANAVVRGHGAWKRPQVLEDGEPDIDYVDTALCFDSDPVVVLTHVEFFLARDVAQGLPLSISIYEPPRFLGDEPTHQLDKYVLPPQRPWPPGHAGKFLHEQLLHVPGGSGRQLVPLTKPLRLGGRPFCCGFRFQDPTMVVPFEVWDGARHPTKYNLPWLPVMWAAPQAVRHPCDVAVFEQFNSPRVKSWGIHFEPVVGGNIEDIQAAVEPPLCEEQLDLQPQLSALGQAPRETANVDAAGMWPVATGTRASAWQQACLLAATDDTAFSTFRQATKRGEIGIISDPFAEVGPLTTDCMLREILEDERTTVTQGIGELLWRLAPSESSQLSMVGAPNMVEVGAHKLPKDMLWPLVMLKWIASRFGSLRGFNVVEVGAGFGGLASMLLRTFAVRSYSIVDLLEVQMLQRRYLSSVGPQERYAGKVVFVPAGVPHDTILLDRYDLFISVCAFSELSKDMQERYFEQLVLRSERGFIVDNRHTASFASGRQLDMEFAGLALLDRLLANGFHAEARTWQAMLPSCETCSPLNLVIFFELRRTAPCHTTSPRLWKQTCTSG